MNISEPFIRRPVGTTLLTAAIALAGGLAYFFIPVSPLPEVSAAAISVSASIPGASPETMASSVATPLERQFGRIAGITQMTSSSGTGSASINLQFDLSRDIDAAARDVQAAINAARSQLPSNLPNNPTYRKVNSADAPVLILALTSNVYDRGKLYDAASSIIQQKLSQVKGVGLVNVGGGALPAVRVDVNPTFLNNLGLGLDDVKNAIANSNANTPKGALTDNAHSWSIFTTDQIFKAADYKPLIVSYKNGAAVRLSDVASVTDSVEDVRNAGLANGKTAVLVIISRQPSANIIDTVDRVTALLPALQAEIPQGMKLSIVMDRTPTIRSSVHDVEVSLLISIALVILVVFVFLRDVRSTFIPSVAVPVSLIGTFGVMYLAGYSIDNLSLMALTISTGFVVDDAIVVIENITRYLEQGLSPLEASLRGAKEINFTVLSISISLIAVFIPILLMSGVVGRLFREFAVTLSVAIAVSMVVSLTTTPMMCAVLLKRKEKGSEGAFALVSEELFQLIHRFYERTLSKVLEHQTLTIWVMVSTVALTIYLFVSVPQGFIPQQDTGRLTGNIQADQDTSFQQMRQLLQKFSDTVSADPAVKSVISFTGGGRGAAVNKASMFITLKAAQNRNLTADQVIGRLRGKLAEIPGATLYLQSVQDVSTGARGGNAQFQYTLQGDSVQELNDWAPKVLAKFRTLLGLADVNIDQQSKGLQAALTIDRPSASRLGISPAALDGILYGAFGQSQVSTLYTGLNQYHVVMEVSPEFLSGPEAFKYVYVHGNNGTLVPLSAFTHYSASNTPLAINHQGQFPAVTVSFNLLPGFSLGNATSEIEKAENSIGLPATIHGSFQGTAQAFTDSASNEWVLLVTALGAVYIVLGILYESYIHPVTILSTLPSAGVGALLALKICGMDRSLIALIGIILLIGIVKKNAIMMIDFALEAERKEGLPPRDAIYKASLLRFRPIMMTTMAALLGGLPLAIGFGSGSELRRPLGITIVGGLIVSQMLTLYTTPVMYLAFERLAERLKRWGKESYQWLRGRVRPAFGLSFLLLLILNSCSVGPNYKRPQTPMPSFFKSAAGEDLSEPQFEKEWWRLFNDQQLNDLEQSACKDNTDLKAAMARVQEARAAARITRSEFFPSIVFDPSVTRSRSSSHGSTLITGGGAAVASGTGGTGGSGVATAVSGGNIRNSYQIPFDLSYEVDVWGRVRRAYEASKAQARASADDYQVVLQTLTADVAQDYFNLRAFDLQDEILARTVGSYREELRLTSKQFLAGLIGRTDVLQVQIQIDSTLQQQLENQRQRDDQEHALAILLGKTPAELSLDRKPLTGAPPEIPAGIPSDVLKHRPDVAEAEQNLIAANATIGVATAAFFPEFSLTGTGGFESLDLKHALDWGSRVWSIGPDAELPIFEGGKLFAGLDQSKAQWKENTAVYRGTILGAVRDVEDSLTDLHRRADEATAQAAAVDASREYLRLSELQYKQGLISHLQVLDAERTLQSNELTAAQILNQRLVSSVLLVKALGSGWNPDPKPKN